MTGYHVKIEPGALVDIQDITDWYNEQLAGLGGRFQETVISLVNGLSKNPQGYAVRYNQIRCMPLKKFPYMVHFYIHEETKTVEVLAVICTSRNPSVWLEKTGKRG